MPNRLIAVLLLLATGGFASAQGVEIRSGQTVRGMIGSAADIHIYRFEGAEGELLALKVKTKKAGGLEPVVRLFSPRRELFVPAAFYGKVTVRNSPLPATGTYYLSIAGKDATLGDYTLSLRRSGVSWPLLTVPTPGRFGINVARDSELSGSVETVRGSEEVVRLISVYDPSGADVLAPGNVSHSASGSRLKRLPSSLSGRHEFDVINLGSGSGAALIKLRSKPFPPPYRTIPEDDRVLTRVEKVRTDGRVFRASAEGTGIVAARVLPGGREPGVPLLEGAARWTLEETIDPGDGPDEGPWADGLYVLRVDDELGRTRDYPFIVDGLYPDPVSITSIGSGDSPRVTWTREDEDGEVAQLLKLEVADRISGATLYEVLLTGSTTDHTIPEGVIPPRWPHRVEIQAITHDHKLREAGREVDGGETTYNFALANGDLGTMNVDARDAGGLRHNWTVVEGYLEGWSIDGDMASNLLLGPFAFDCQDDVPLSRSFPAVLAPGLFVAGADRYARVFAGTPVNPSSFVAREIAGDYNYVEVWGSGGSAVAGTGTIRLETNKSFALWEESDTDGTPVVQGTWNDIGGGLVRVWRQSSLVGTLMLVGSEDGGRVLVMRRAGGGVLVGARQEPLVEGTRDGRYDLVNSRTGRITPWRLLLRELRDPGQAVGRLKLNRPWTGMFSTTIDGEDLVGLVAPEGYMAIVGRSSGGDRLLVGTKE